MPPKNNGSEPQQNIEAELKGVLHDPHFGTLLERASSTLFPSDAPLIPETGRKLLEMPTIPFETREAYFHTLYLTYLRAAQIVRRVVERDRANGGLTCILNDTEVDGFFNEVLSRFEGEFSEVARQYGFRFPLETQRVD